MNTVTLTFAESSGAMFELQSFYLSGNYAAQCNELLTISGTTNGGSPNPACVKAPLLISGTSAPVKIDFDPPCLATTITINAIFSDPGFCQNLGLTLDDITLCPISATDSNP